MTRLGAHIGLLLGCLLAFTACGPAPAARGDHLSPKAGKADHDSSPAQLWTGTDPTKILNWSTESGLTARIDSELLPALRQAQQGTFIGEDGIEIAYLKVEDPNAVAKLVILNGRSESYAEYIELIDDLKGQGFSLYLMDHRGQGFSGRMLEDSERGYVADFNDYVKDLHTFISTVVGHDATIPLLGLAHSMGGAIISAYAIEHPNAFRALALSAPMIKVESGKTPNLLMVAMAEAARLGFDEHYVLGKGPYDAAKPFADNVLTHSQARFAMQKRINEVEYPAVRLGGPTWRWLQESIHRTFWLRFDADRLVTPTLLVQALEDQVVVPQAQTEFCADALACYLLPMSGARHELLMESDATRNVVLTSMLDFFFAAI